MTLGELRSLQGRHVSVALADHSSVEDAVLEGVVESEKKLWLHAGGSDVFVMLDDVVDVWETHGRPGPRA